MKNTVFILVVLLPAVRCQARIITIEPYMLIQEAIDDSNDGDIIILNPGIYTFYGNRDIDFKGKAITVRSADPNDPAVVAATVIDGEAYIGGCPGPLCERHLGFIFRSGEGPDSVLAGLTITGFCAPEDPPMSMPEPAGGGIFCKDSSPTISHCVITANSAYHSPCGGFGGGGIHCEQSSPTITHCTISNNKAHLTAGGICSVGGSPTISHCTIINNSCTHETGGIACYSGGTVTNCVISGNKGGGVGGAAGGAGGIEGRLDKIENCTISNNKARYCGVGGGIHCYSSNCIIRNCEITGNFTYPGDDWGKGFAGKGGGIYISGNPMMITISQCTIRNNRVLPGPGAGIYLASGNTVIENSTITGNSARSGDVLGDWFDGEGGGIFCKEGNLTIIQCTIADNSAGARGGGIYGDLNMANCILWSNTAPNEPEISGSPEVSYSDIQGGWGGTGNINADPCFADAAGGNFRLSKDSPCIDVGDNSAPNLPATDLDGNPRVIDGDNDSRAVVDMGAYEFSPPLRLVAHWKLDEQHGDIAYDSAGENHGTLYGGPLWQPTGGKVGGALQFGDGNDYVDCGNDPNIFDLTDEITLSAWINIDSVPRQWSTIVSKGDSAWRLSTDRFSTRIHFAVRGGAVPAFGVNSHKAVPTGEWHHVCGTFDGPSIRIYIDGVEDNNNLYSTTITTNDLNVFIGGNSEDDPNGYRSWDGLIDDVRIYNYALTTDQIVQLLCTESLKGNFDNDCNVNFRDFSILARAWMTHQGEPGWHWTFDISNPPNDHIDWRDVAVLCENWLAGFE